MRHEPPGGRDSNKGAPPLDLPKIQRVPSEPRAVEVARSLLQHLVFSGSVKVGDKLPAERQLAEAFGVGRSAVREALKSLSLLGLVEIRQGDGTYLRRPDSELLPQVIEWGLLLGERRTLETVEARQHIERAIARLAAERRVDADLEALSGWLAQMEASIGDREQFVEADVGFHLELARTSDNRVLADILLSLQSLLRVWVNRVIRNADDPRVNFLEHQAIYEAVERGDPDAAEEAMRAHLHTAGKKLIEALDRTVYRSSAGSDGT